MKKSITNKNIFRPLAFLLLVLTGFSACKKDDQIEPKIFFNTEDALSVSNKATEQSVVIVSNMDWTAQADVDWITIAEAAGEKGKDTVRFSVAQNDDEERTGILTISTASGGLAKEIRVVQESGLAANFYVKAGASGEGRSFDEPASLDYALKNAVSGTVIHIAAGTYIPESTITGGDSSDPGDITFEINKNITLIGGYPANAAGKAVTADPAVNKTILSGQLSSGEAYHVVTVSAPKIEDQKVVLNGLVITGGNASTAGTSASINGAAFRRDYGGGMTIGGALVEINNCEIIENRSEKFVAGLFIFGDASVTIKNSKINKNISKSNGAGIWANASKVYIYGSEVNENETSGTAAGVHAYPDAALYMYNSTVANNKGKSYGAAVYLRQRSTGVLVNCLIYGNESTSGNGGGGLMMYDNCEADVISSTITKNTIAGPGGGVYRRSNVNTLRIYNSIISGNSQKAGSSDVDVYEASADAPLIQASVIGDKAYNTAGSEIDGASFNPVTMLSASFLPIADNNPALTAGMNASALNTLGGTFNPPLEALISSDLNGESRSGVNIMGALVK